MATRLKPGTCRSPIKTLPQGSLPWHYGQSCGTWHTGLLCELWGVLLDMWHHACDCTLILSLRPAWTIYQVFLRATRIVLRKIVSPAWLGGQCYNCSAVLASAVDPGECSWLTHCSWADVLTPPAPAGITVEDRQLHWLCRIFLAEPNMRHGQHGHWCMRLFNWRKVSIGSNNHKEIQLLPLLSPVSFPP